MRPDGFYWVKWCGRIRPKHPWNVRHLVGGKWKDAPENLPEPDHSGWTWGERITPPATEAA